MSKVARRSRPLQFSLWGLLVLTTVVAVTLGIPGGRWVVGSIGVWLVIATGILGGLIVIQLPLAFLHHRLLKEEETTTKRDTPAPDMADTDESTYTT